MPGKARTGDFINHGGTITASQFTVMADNLGVCVIGDTALCSLHGTQKIVSGSGSVLINGKLVARIGDTISCGATIVTGSAITGIGLPNKPSSLTTTFMVNLSDKLNTSDLVII